MWKKIVGGIALCALAASANANTVTSQDPDCEFVGPTPIRTYSVTAVSVVKCLFAGSGNINGNPDDNSPGNEGDVAMFNAGWELEDETFLGSGSSPVAFSIDLSLYDEFYNVAIGFKGAVGQLDPDWAIFEFTRGTTDGVLTISPTQAGGFSHAVLWTRGTPDDCLPGDRLCEENETPEPASLALVGLALAGLGLSQRRRRK